MQLGGFDYTIASAHWQTLDFFMRGWLWGEKTVISTLYSFSYESDFPVEDLTVDLSYSRFFLKNLLPRFDEDHGVIPKSSLFVYLLRSGCGLIESCRQFFFREEGGPFRAAGLKKACTAQQESSFYFPPVFYKIFCIDFKTVFVFRNPVPGIAKLSAWFN